MSLQWRGLYTFNGNAYVPIDGVCGLSVYDHDGPETWDDTYVDELYEMEKAAGNIYVSEGEEATLPGAWVPVTQSVNQTQPFSWNPALSPVSPVQAMVVVPRSQSKTRGNGKLFNTVFPQQEVRKGKLYETVVVQNGASENQDRNPDSADDKGSVDVEQLVRAAYLAGYQAGYEAARSPSTGANTKAYHNTQG